MPHSCIKCTGWWRSSKFSCIQFDKWENALFLWSFDLRFVADAQFKAVRLNLGNAFFSFRFLDTLNGCEEVWIRSPQQWWVSQLSFYLSHCENLPVGLFSYPPLISLYLGPVSYLDDVPFKLNEKFRCPAKVGLPIGFCLPDCNALLTETQVSLATISPLLHNKQLQWHGGKVFHKTITELMEN